MFLYSSKKTVAPCQYNIIRMTLGCVLGKHPKMRQMYLFAKDFGVYSCQILNGKPISVMFYSA